MNNARRTGRTPSCAMTKGSIQVRLVASAFFACAVLFIAADPGKIHGADAQDPSFSIMIGYMATVFVDVDMDDAKVVTKLWSDMVVRKKRGRAETKVYQDLPELERDLKAGKVDMAIMVSNDFVELRNRVPIEPIMVSSREKEFYEELYLLVRKDSGIKSVKDLRNKTFILQKGQYAVVHKIWLETLLMNEGGHDARQFFSSVKDARKPSQAVMPVFFRQADACIITRNGFDVMAEMNPQLRNELLVLARSPKIASGVIALRKDFREDRKETVRELLSTLHEDTQGKQLLTLFRMSKLVPFRQEYMTGMEAFLREHRDLKVRVAKGK
ncbi:MAG TPA: PhnD/SsuA/transferrin family substrate-binding protein [Dissulfurispiraceae bacterium]|nr:PhnD/SsuA/transferrin family substrate-binding protein [Dissulfurispiraceae bacterium]